jgi:preprotein translocase subunit SecG
MSVFYFLTLVVFILLCTILCGLILVQESKSTGLGASFGGGDTGDSFFGAATADVLKKVTAYFACAYLAFCLILSFWTESLDRANSFKAETATESLEKA